MPFGGPPPCISSIRGDEPVAPPPLRLLPLFMDDVFLELGEQ